MKRLVSLLLAVIMTLSLAACGNQKAEKYCSHCGNGLAKEATVCDECDTAVNGENEKKTTTTTTTTTAKPKPKTTKRTTTTTTVRTTTTKTTTTTTTTTAPKTTRAATQEEIDAITEYIMDLYLPQFEYKQYQQQCVIEDIQAEIDAAAVEYATNEIIIREKYANMGLLESGAYQNALNGLYNTYNNKVRPLNEQLELAQEEYEEMEWEFEEMIIEMVEAEVKKLELSTLA